MLSKKTSLYELERAYKKDPANSVAITRYLAELARNATGDPSSGVVSAILKLIEDLPRPQQVELYEHIFRLHKEPAELLPGADKEVLAGLVVKDHHASVEKELEKWLNGKDPHYFDHRVEMSEDHKVELRRLFSLSSYQTVEKCDDPSRDIRSYHCKFCLGSRTFSQSVHVEWYHEHEFCQFKDLSPREEFDANVDFWSQLQSDLESALPAPLLASFMVLLRFGGFESEDAMRELDDCIDLYQSFSDELDD